MAVTVTMFGSKDIAFENADDWEIDAEFGILSIHKRNQDNTVTIVGSFSIGNWSCVKKNPKQDKTLLFEEAVEIIREVDDGNFGHQSTEWQDRATSFLTSVGR